MLDTFGSALGPLILSGLLLIFVQHNVAPGDYYRWLLILSALVLLITIAIIQFGVKETKKAAREPAAVRVPLARSFYLFTAIAGVFGIANSSDAFLILRSQNLGLSVIAIPLACALLNIIYGALALPAGILSDRIDRIPLISIGWTVYGVCYLGFALADSAWQLWPLFALYGVFYAVTEGVSRALIADTVGQEGRGRAYGIYNMVVGIAALPAGLIAGQLWDGIGPSAPFFFSAILSFAAVVMVLLFRRRLVPKALVG